MICLICSLLLFCVNPRMLFSHLHLHLFKPQYNTVNVLFSMRILNDFQLNNYMQYINSIACYQLLAFACISLLVCHCVYYAFSTHTYMLCIYVCCSPFGLYCNQSLHNEWFCGETVFYSERLIIKIHQLRPCKSSLSGFIFHSSYNLIFNLLKITEKKIKFLWRTSSTSDASNFYNYELTKTFTQGTVIVQ